MIERYTHAVTAGDVAAIVDMYAEDALLVRVGQVCRGRESIEAWWHDYLTNLGKVTEFTIDQTEETDELILLEAVLHTEFGTAELVEVMTIAGDLITQHATAVTAMHMFGELD